MNSGIFISFEGIDGTGKSVQIRLLANALERRGHNVFMTKEPGDALMGSNVGAGIRELVFKNPTTKSMRPGVADLLFLADHIQTAGDVAEKVAEGHTVLTDRYADSQFAYAASETKQCPEWALRYYHEQYGIVPDITVLLVARGPQVIREFTPTHANLDLSGEISIAGRVSAEEDIAWALGRAKGRKGTEAGKQDGKRWNDVAEQRKIQNAYLTQIGKEPRTLLVHVWEESSIDDVHERVLTGVLSKLIQSGNYRLVPGEPVGRLVRSPDEPTNYAPSY